MKYLALKACRFSGRDYSTGELIEDTAIDKKSIGALISMGFIKKADSPPSAPVPSYSQRIPEPATPKNKKKPPKVGDDNAEMDIQS